MRHLLIITALALAACEPVDHGLLVDADGRELRPLIQPWVVYHSADVRDQWLDEAADWWADEIGAAVFDVDHDRGLYLELDLHEPTSSSRDGTILVSVAYPQGEGDCSPWDEGCWWEPHELGQATLHHSEGFIISAEVVVSPDVYDSERWAVAVIVHELGHCLGLDDDPDSVDLDSIMSSPVVPGRGLTDHDRALLVDSLGLW